MPDAITLLKTDHKRVKSLFRAFERASGTQEQRRIVDEIVTELSVHAVIEEQVFYPAVRRALPKVEDTVLEGLEEHHVAKWTLAELDGMDPDDERFKAKVTVLIESVEHHVEEEEGELFPEVREAIGRKDLRELGDVMEAAKGLAPTKPRPRASDEPPDNPLTGPMAPIADRLQEVLGRLVAAVEDGGSGKNGGGTAKARGAVKSGAAAKAGGSAKSGATAKSGGTGRTGAAKSGSKTGGTKAAASRGSSRAGAASGSSRSGGATSRAGSTTRTTRSSSGGSRARGGTGSRARG